MHFVIVKISGILTLTIKPFIYIYTHTHIHTYIHTYTHTHISGMLHCPCILYSKYLCVASMFVSMRSRWQNLLNCLYKSLQLHNEYRSQDIGYGVILWPGPLRERERERERERFDFKVIRFKFLIHEKA